MKLLSAAMLLATPAFASAAPDFYFLLDKPTKPAKPVSSTNLGNSEPRLVFDLQSIPEAKRASITHRLLQQAAQQVPAAPQKRGDASTNLRPLIVGGGDAEYSERPYQVSLQYGQSHFCGGALIADRWVMTAAHCIEGRNYGDLVYAIAGVNDLEDPNLIAMPVVSLNGHAEFDPATIDNDIALLMLAAPMPESVARLPLISPEQMDTYALPGTLAEVSGWGSTDPDQGLFPTILQKLETTLLDQAECNEHVREFMEREFFEGAIDVTENMICTGDPEPQPSACYGDSGGPVTVEIDGTDHSIGIVSWAPGYCGLFHGIAVSSKVSNYLDWIDATQASAVVQAPLGATPLEPSLPLTGISATAGSTQHYSFYVSDAARNLDLTFTSSDGEASLEVFAGAYTVEASQVCGGDASASTQTCQLSLAPHGIYHVALTAITDFNDGELVLNFDPPFIEDGAYLTGIDIPAERAAVLFLTLTDANQTLEVTTGEGTGDLDLTVFRHNPADNAYYEVCGSYNIDSNEERCLVEHAEPGQYAIYLVGYSRVQDATLTLDVFYSPPPATPHAICQHSVVAQIGDGFISAITIANISDQYISDWYVEWGYGLPVIIDRMFNGILTGYDPLRAESPERGRAISPGAITTIYVYGTSPSGVINNPTVSGNYCR